MSEFSANRQSTLHPSVQSLYASLDLNEVLNELLDQVMTVIQAECALVILRLDGQLAHPVARGMDPHALDHPAYHAVRELVERVAEQARPEWATVAMYTGLPRSMLCVPIQHEEDRLGVIYVEMGNWSGPFGLQELDLLADVSASAGGAIHNALLFREARDRIKDLHLLQKINTDLTTTLDLNRVLTVCLERVLESLGTETASILTVQGNELVFEVALGEKASQVKPFRVPIGQGIAGWVAEHAEGTLTNDVRRDARFYSAIDDGTGFKTQALMAAPLIANHRVIGVLEVSNKREAFSPADLELLSAIAASAAIAIENARLYEEASRAADELRRLYETSLDVTSQLEISKLLALMIERAAGLLKADSGNFFFYDDKTDELVPTVPIGDHLGAPMLTMKPGEGASGRVFQSGEPLAIEDYDRWEGRSPKISPGRYSRVLHVPLKRGGQVMGLMTVNRGRDAPPFSDADVRLLMLFANQAAIAIENARLFQESIEKGKMERELQVAYQVQASLIPSEAPQIPGWEFVPLWRPARVVAGDLYDFIPLNLANQAEPCHGLVIGDVSDKGLGAALFMAVARSILRASAAASTAPVQCITQANRLLCQDAANGMFVSLFYAQLNPVTGELIYVNAGHNPPLLYRAREDRLIELPRTGVVLGIQPDWLYRENSVQMQTGDLLVLYTDGVTDATNAAEETFGDEKLKRVMREHSGAPAAEMVAALQSALDTFTGSTAQFDDITVVIVKRS